MIPDLAGLLLNGGLTGRGRYTHRRTKTVVELWPGPCRRINLPYRGSKGGIEMHIGKKILADISPVLDEYYLFGALNTYKWRLFTRPLAATVKKIDVKRFEKRQREALRIIHAILKPHGKALLGEAVAQVADVEPKVQDLQNWVRDHVVHALNTFLLGVYILKRVEFPSVQQRYKPRFRWKLTGPTHDLGYPIEIAGNIQKRYLDAIEGEIDRHRSRSPSPKVQQEAFPENLGALCFSRSGHDLIQGRLDDWGLGIDVFDY